MRKIEFGDDDGDDGEPIICFLCGEGEIEIDVLDCEDTDTVTLNYDEVVRLRDFLTEWLNAP